MILTYDKINKLAEFGTEMGPFKLILRSNEQILSLGGVELSLEYGHYHSSKTRVLKQWIYEHTKVVLGDYNICKVAIDVLYNFYIDKVTKSNGVIKQSSIRELNTRQHSAENVYTNHFINKLVAAGLNPLEIGSNVKSIHNYTTGALYYFTYWMYQDINDIAHQVPRGVNLSDLGYEANHLGTEYSWYLPDEPREDYEGVTYRASQLQPCDECHTRVPHRHSGICTHCLGVDPELVVIRGYNDRAPSFMSYKLGKYSTSLYKAPLYFGVELEYEAEGLDKALLDTARLLGKHAIFKRDGSIRNGFEIVTTPATLDHQKEAFEKFFTKFPKDLKSASNTGMHIHISREPLNMLTQGKLVEFMNREDNKNFIEKIAGRLNNGYTQQDTRRGITYPFKNRTGERYNTLNINNEHTLEFRIFATPTTWKEFEQRIEFVDALTAYCSPCQAKATDLKQVTSHTNFIEYVKLHKNTWKALSEFLFPKDLTKFTAYKAKGAI